MKKQDDTRIAKERIIYLFRQAQKALEEGNKGMSKKYVELALKIGMKTKTHIPNELKRKYCKKCHALWIASKTVRVRTKKKEKRVVFTCLECGAVRRYPYLKEKL